MKNAKLQLEAQSSENKAYDYATFLLNIRLRTEGELREKMRSKKYEVRIIDEVIGQLKDQNYINDKRFAEVFLENLMKYKNWGYYGIKKKMMEKKLPMSLIESVLSENLNEEEELEIAKRIIKKENSLPASGERVREGSKEEKARLARKLAAKGFRVSIISKLIF